MIKLKNIIRISIIACFALLFQACPDSDFIFLDLKNNSNDTLAVYIADGFHTAYPDTLLKNQGRLWGSFPKETSTIYGFSIAPEKIYKRLPKDTLSIFILDMNNTYGIKMDSIWKEMNYGKRFLRRYDMSIQDIKQLKFLLSYPPDERMRNMKMYPPYDK
jgi:hypothetical protein